MATARNSVVYRVSSGGEEKRFEMTRDLTVVGLAVADPTLNIVENTPGAPTLLWQGAGHGLAGPTAEFTQGLFGVDLARIAADAGYSPLPLDLELAFTSTAGAVVTRTLRVPSEIVFQFGPNAGVTGAAMTDILTRIRCTNPAGVGSPANSNDRQARLLLVK